MAIYFLDSSALLKRYVNEVGTAWIQTLFDPGAGHRISVATICGAEIVAAISRRVKGRGLAAVDGARAIQRFKSDFQSEFELIDISMNVIQSAIGFADRLALRGYDSVQLAAASVFNSGLKARGLGVVTFVSSDLELNTATTAEGFIVENPMAYP